MSTRFCFFSSRRLYNMPSLLIASDPGTVIPVASTSDVRTADALLDGASSYVNSSTAAGADVSAVASASSGTTIVSSDVPSCMACSETRAAC